ncbi:MAG: hypothetical protein K2W85_04165 [Phycisphaerales bacterium]|nr:hypothetical protein [Phycisphaerales bacterium]
MPVAYAPSNRVGSNTFLLLIPMLIAAGVLGAIYGVVMKYIPLIILDILAVMGFAFASGLFASLAVKIGKCRSPVFAIGYGVLAGLIGLVASHYAGYLLETRGVLPAPTLWEYVQWRVDNGWKIGRASTSGNRTPINGVFVWIAWGVEAGAIVWVSAKMARAQAREPFCEPCERWATLETLKFGVPGLSMETTNRMRSGNLEEILTPPIAEIDHAPSSLEYRVRTCPACNASRFLDLKNKIVTVDKKGKVTENTVQVGGFIQLAPEEAEALGQLRDDVSTILAAKMTPQGAAVAQDGAPPTVPGKS